MAATYLTVPFREKDDAKALGARWDAGRRQWYVPDGVALAGFERWLPAGSPAEAAPRASGSLGAARRPLENRSIFETAAFEGPAALAPAVLSTGDAALSAGGLAVREPEAGSLAPAVPRGVPLSRLLTAVAGVVAEHFGTPVWVTAELLRVASGAGGHVYLELSERDPQGRVVAKAQAAIWSRVAQAILPPFEKATGVTLAAGIKLMVRAKPVFKAQYGFSLEIDAIDPAYTLGDLAAKKREIRERLQREGLFDRNRRLPAPWDFAFVLVVAPAGAAGLGDFAEEARRLERHGLCRFSYAHSRFQGPEAAAEIVATAQALVAGHLAAEPDALIIIRGGGAVNDLAWLDDYALARFICECPLPVLTGIGHERDSTVLDEVAHRRFDTPSKVVLGIEQRIAQRANEARDAMGLIVGQANDAIIRARTAAERRFAGVRESAGVAIGQARQLSERRLGQVQLGATRRHQAAAAEARAALAAVAAEARQQLATAQRTVPVLRDQILADARDATREARERLDTAIRSVDRDARRIVHDAGRMSEALVREIAGQGPQKTLGRGFALVRGPDDSPLTGAAAAARAGRLQIEFQDGRVDADVARQPPRSTP